MGTSLLDEGGAFFCDFSFCLSPLRNPLDIFSVEVSEGGVFIYTAISEDMFLLMAFPIMEMDMLII